jgi:hypothetical protein
VSSTPSVAGGLEPGRRECACAGVDPPAAGVRRRSQPRAPQARASLNPTAVAGTRRRDTRWLLSIPHDSAVAAPHVGELKHELYNARSTPTLFVASVRGRDPGRHDIGAHRRTEGKRGGYASAKQNFSRKTETAAVRDHGITTRRADAAEPSRCRRTRRG